MLWRCLVTQAFYRTSSVVMLERQPNKLRYKCLMARHCEPHVEDTMEAICVSGISFNGLLEEWKYGADFPGRRK